MTSIRSAIADRTATVCVVGQGYVGLTLAAAATTAGFRVWGLDIDAARVASLRDGGTVPGVEASLVAEAVATGRLAFTTDYALVGSADVTLICVPTPLTNHAPDMRYIEEACDQVAARLLPSRLVVLESTTYPGTTDEVVAPRLAASGLVPGRDFYLAYSPERIDPGNPEWRFDNTPKVVGGYGAESADVAALFYEQLCSKVVTVSSCRSAELSKLLENTFRQVNIALVNEMAMACEDMGIDVWEVVEATATKPFGFMRFLPGPGVGGHCIPLDPTYLAWKVRSEAGRRFQMIEIAQDINEQMPAYVAGRIAQALNERSKAVRGARVLVLGVSYKVDVGDVRESPSLYVIGQLLRRGAEVSFHDPFVDSVRVGEAVLERSDAGPDSFSGADCVALLTPHSSYDIDQILEHAPLLFDARNASAGRTASNLVRL